MATKAKEKSEKPKTKNILKKTVEGYGYRYTDLAGIHNYLDEVEMRYWQEIENDDNGEEYITTHLTDLDGNEIRKARGCKIVKSHLSGKSNPVQEYGSSITYARRYSLLMALGLATEDDDGEISTVRKGQAPKPKPKLDFTEVRKKIKETATLEELVQIYNGIPENLREFFTDDFKKRKGEIN